MLKKMKSNSGQSLVQVLVSLAISAIIIITVMQIASDQTKSLKYFTQKSDVTDLKNFISQALNNSTVCDWQFKASGATLNIASLSTQSIPFDKIYSGLDSNSPVLVEVGSKFSGLVVNSITYKNIVAAGPPDLYSGDLEIAFDQATAARPIASQRIRKNVYLDSFHRIVACGTLSSGISAATKVLGPWGKGFTSATCPIGYQLSMCHAEVNSADGMSLMFQQHITMSGPTDQLTTCSSNMGDSDDFYRLVLVCLK